jgi:dienelactone hydrolase
MPDVFRGKAFPIDKDGNKEELGKFFQGTYVSQVAYLEFRSLMERAKITDRQPEIVEFAKGLKKDGYEKVSLLGYCWGVSSLCSYV